MLYKSICLNSAFLTKLEFIIDNHYDLYKVLAQSKQKQCSLDLHLDLDLYLYCIIKSIDLDLDKLNLLIWES